MTGTFEEAFAAAELSAEAAARAGKSMAAAARQMQRAAREGDIAKLRSAIQTLGLAADAARDGSGAKKAWWPFSDAEARAYLAESYQREFLAEAERAGLSVHVRDGQLLAFPSIVQILPHELAVRVDRKRFTAIRASHLVQRLLDNQTRGPRYPAERFLEALHSAYRMIVGRDGAGRVIALVQVYQAFTLAPGSAREYSRSDFARDLFVLDRCGTTRTRSGARLALPASTGTKGGGSHVFTFVAPDGEVVNYYGLQFSEV